MYHHINWHKRDLVTLTPTDFETHLQVLGEKGIQTLFLDELVESMGGKKILSHPAVALTFDDGYLDNWVYAFPLLKKYRAKATFFVITSWMTEGRTRNQWDPQMEGPQTLPDIPRHNEAKKKSTAGDFSAALRWEEAKEMEKSGLVDIQSHTHFHQDYFLMKGKTLRLDPKNKDDFLEDLVRSKEWIEKKLAKKCRFLSWPWGRYDAQAVKLAQELGFQAMVTTEKGINYPGSEETKIKRIVAKSGEAGWFRQRLKIYSNRALGGIYSRVAGKI